MSCPRSLKTKLYPELKEPKKPYEAHQELADLKVECENKTKTIKENEKYIEEMKSEIKSLTEKYEALQKKHSQIEDLHQKDIESMVKLHTLRHYLHIFRNTFLCKILGFLFEGYVTARSDR